MALVVERKILEEYVKTLPPPRVIYSRDGSSPYLSRWYLQGGPRSKTGGDSLYDPAGNLLPDVSYNAPFSVMLHKFHRSDEDQELHSHPWRFAWAIILAGGYVEERRGNYVRRSVFSQYYHEVKRTTYKPGDIVKLYNDTYHRVDLLEEDSWSLFIAGIRADSWSFWNRHTDETTPWREFVSKKQQELKRSCDNCANCCMDMDLNPYCSAVNSPWGHSLHTGRPTMCGDDLKLWEIDTRRSSK